MLLRSGRTRPGISLLEVLTAIFIMGIGMLALLTLFPLGALSMARAIRDDRAAHIAANAAALAAAMDLRNDVNVATEISATDAARPGGVIYVDAHFARLSYPTATVPTTPIGRAVQGPTTLTPGLRRTHPKYVERDASEMKIPLALAARWFTFQEEITFNTVGAPKVFGQIDRPGTYTYAYLVRRPRLSAAELTEITVVVYASRNIDTLEVEQTLALTSGGPMDTINQTSLTVPWTGANVRNTTADKPDFRKGVYILDTTFTNNTVAGQFYRIESATETGNNFILELDRPLKSSVNAIVVMKNVVAVVERGTAWRP